MMKEVLTFTPAEKVRAEQFALEQLVVAMMAALCKLRPGDDLIRQTIAKEFEKLAGGFKFDDVTSAAKAEMARHHMMTHGLDLIGQVLPQPID